MEDDMSRKAKTFVIDPRITELEDARAHLSDRDKNFAKDLINNYVRTHGHLSIKQWEWVKILTERASRANVVPFNAASSEIADRAHSTNVCQSVMQIPGFAKVEDGLYKSKKFIKLAINPTQTLVLTPGRAHRGVNVKVNDSFIGVVRNEVLQPQFGDAELVGLAFHVMHELAFNFEQKAREHGKTTGNCCFCGIELTDPRSLAAGYGPICAGNYNLPWGKVDMDTSDFDATIGSMI